MTIVTSPFERWTNLNGQPLEQGYIYIGANEQDPQTNPIPVYWDVDLTIPAEQPLRTVAGIVVNAGSPATVYVKTTPYSMRVRQANGVQVFYKSSVGATLPTSVDVDAFASLVTNDNWEVAVRAAIDAVAPGGQVNFSSQGKFYEFKGCVYVTKPGLTFRGNNSTVRLTALDSLTGDLVAFRVQADKVKFTRLKIDAAGAPVATGPVQFLIEFSANHVRGSVDHCEIGAMPFSTSAAQSGIAFRGGANNGSVRHCIFETGVGGVFTQGGFTQITRNEFYNPGDISIAFNGPGASGGVATNNSIYASGLSISGHIAGEEGPSNLTITDNTIIGGYGPAISLLNVALFTPATGGQIARNWIDGQAQTGANPSALIRVSPYYSDIDIFDNDILNAPVGNNNNASIICWTTSVRLYGNRIRPGAGAAGFGILVNCNGGDILIEGNDYLCTQGIASVYITGNNGAQPIRCKANRWNTLAFGIVMTAAPNTLLFIQDDEFPNCAQPVIGTRFDDLIVAGWRFPYKVNETLDMFGAAMPTTGSWKSYDVVRNYSPSVLGAAGSQFTIDSWKRITTGSGNVLNVDWVQSRGPTGS